MQAIHSKLFTQAVGEKKDEMQNEKLQKKKEKKKLHFHKDFDLTLQK